MDRVEREMTALEPTCSTYRHQYTTAADLVKYSTLLTTTKTATVLGFVQMRTASGAISSAWVWADWETRKVSVTGWPLPPGTGGLTYSFAGDVSAPRLRGDRAGAGDG